MIFEQILIDLSFPQFKNKNKSTRFFTLFQELSRIENQRIRKFSKINNENYAIILDKIEKGEDKRTSVVIENIPKQMTKSQLGQILEGLGNINYLYLPYNNLNECLGYALVNVINYKNVIQIYNKLNGFIFEENMNPFKVHYCTIQGRHELRRFYAKKNHINKKL